MEQKYFYLHIPKTAGTTFNNFLAESFPSDKCSFHIEIENDINYIVENSTVISGHIPFVKAKKIIPNIDDYIKLTVFREPIEQLSSHLRFVRKLAEPSEKNRLLGHTKEIQQIVARLAKTDLSSIESIREFISWLERENIVFFHNTQLQYLVGSRFLVTEKILQEAKLFLNTIDYVGTTDRLDDYMSLLSYKLNFKKNNKKIKKLNVTRESFGLNIDNNEVREVLDPLICYDKIIYNQAKEKFEKDFILLFKHKKNRFHKYLDRIRIIFNK